MKRCLNNETRIESFVPASIYIIMIAILAYSTAKTIW